MAEHLLDGLFIILLSSLAASWATARFFPIGSGTMQMTLTATEERVYQRLANWGSALLLLPGIGTIWLWAYLLAKLNLMAASRNGDNLYTHTMGPGVLFLIAIFLGCGSAFYLLPQLFRLLLRQKYLEFRQYTSELYGYDWVRASSALAKMIISVGIVLTLPVINSYTRVTANEVILNDIFSLRETQYQVDGDVTSIREHRRRQDEGEPGEKVYYIVEFSDGNHWRTDSYAPDRIPTNISDSIGYISERAGIPVQTVVDQ